MILVPFTRLRQRVFASYIRLYSLSTMSRTVASVHASFLISFIVILPGMCLMSTSDRVFLNPNLTLKILWSVHSCSSVDSQLITSKFVKIWSRWLPLLWVLVLSGRTGLRFLVSQHSFVILIRCSLKSPLRITFEFGTRSKISAKIFSRFAMTLPAFSLFYGSM